MNNHKNKVYKIIKNIESIANSKTGTDLRLRLKEETANEIITLITDIIDDKNDHTDIYKLSDEILNEIDPLGQG